MKVCAYLRVSTGRQAERDLSIPDQQKQIEIHCGNGRAELVRVFVELGASAMDENRPVFQEMIDWVTGPDHPVDAIVVHSYSRFVRDAFLAEFYIRRLAKAGVRLDSVTQETGTDSTGELIRKIIALFEEYSSRENAKHVLRSMKRNAALGYWNGSVPPFGYRTVEVGKKGTRRRRYWKSSQKRPPSSRRCTISISMATVSAPPTGLRRSSATSTQTGFASAGASSPSLSSMGF